MMTEPLLIIFLSLLLLVLIIFIRGRIIDLKIMKHSKKIELLLELNQSYIFHQITNSIEIRKHYDNKSSFNKIEPGYLMAAEIRNNLDKISIYISKVKENRENKKIYNEKVKSILSQQLDIEYKNLKIFKKEYLYRAKKLLHNLILNPIIDCQYCVYMSYSSTKGQVNLSKNECFSFNDLVTSYESVSRSYLDKNTYLKLALVERGDLSDSLRYDILNRDNFKCVICGASSREGVRLHVDHIIPVSKGGKSIPSNLRTLCERCNVGKSNKLEDISDDESLSDDTEILICPKCGSQLVLRHGKNGDFYGCSNFPKCKYTQSV